MGYTAAAGESPHHDIIIEDPALREQGFTKFSLPLNGNDTMMAVHNTDKRKMMYPDFYKSDLDRTVQSLKEKIISDGILIDDDTADSLVRYFRNACVLLSEDEDCPFFKNGNGKWNGNGNRRSKSKKSDDKSNSFTNIVEALLESDSDEDEDEGEQVTKIDPSKDLDPHIPDKDYAEYTIRSIKKTVKQEDSLVRQLFYTALSKDAASPQNLAVLAPTSEGKTHPVLETLKYFSERDVWTIGSMSPKVIIRQNGSLVDHNNEPLEHTIKKYKKQIRHLKNEIERNKNASKKVSDLEDQIEAMKDIVSSLSILDQLDNKNGFIYSHKNNITYQQQIMQKQKNFLQNNPIHWNNVLTEFPGKVVEESYSTAMADTSGNGKDESHLPTPSAAAMSKEALDVWYQKQRETIKPPDPSLFAFSGYRCYYCSFETDGGKGSKSRDRKTWFTATREGLGEMMTCQLVKQDSSSSISHMERLRQNVT